VPSAKYAIVETWWYSTCASHVH